MMTFVDPTGDGFSTEPTYATERADFHLFLRKPDEEPCKTDHIPMKRGGKRQEIGPKAFGNVCDTCEKV